MVYLLVIIGLIMIYFSLKFGKLPENNNNFSNILKNNLEGRELQDIKNQLQDFSDRLELLENSILVIGEELQSYKKVDSNYEDLENTAAHELMEIKEETGLREEIKKSLNSTLYQLFDEGKTVDEISSITRIGKGEILLRLGLRKQEG